MASTNSTSSFTAVNEGEFSHLGDLNGKIIVKAEYGADIRKVPILNDEITYDELVLMMVRLFKLAPADEIELKYRDEDDDLVSIVDGNDLAFAIQCSRILKLKVIVNARAPSVRAAERKVIRDELIEIRNRCIDLLDKLDNVATLEGSSGAVDESSTDQQQQKLVEAVQALKVADDAAKKASSPSAPPPKEFDPLNSLVNSSASVGGPKRSQSPAVATLQPSQSSKIAADQLQQNKSSSSPATSASAPSPSAGSSSAEHSSSNQQSG